MRNRQTHFEQVSVDAALENSSTANYSAGNNAGKIACATFSARAPTRSSNSEAQGKELVPRAAMRRLIWFNSAEMEAWVCSECAWAFKPSGPPLGNTLEEMKENFEGQREKEFAAHVCAEHRKTKGQSR